MLRLHSFNSQGGFKRKAKSIRLNSLSDRECINVLLIQESGSEKTGFVQNEHFLIGDVEFVCIAVGKDEFCSRCTTIICVEAAYKEFFTPLETVTVGVNRPDIIILYQEGLEVGKEFLIATLHAIPNPADSITQVKSTLKELETNKLPWVLFGDFNSSPEDYLDSKEKSLRPTRLYNVNIATIDNCYMYFPLGYTQGARGERTNLLDFMFVSPYNKTISCSIILSDPSNESIYDNNGKVISDHNMVSISIDFSPNIA